MTGMSMWRRRFAIVCAVAALGLAGAGWCRAGDDVATSRFDPWQLPARMRQALADRWAKFHATPNPTRRDGVQRASYTGDGPGSVPAAGASNGSQAPPKPQPAARSRLQLTGRGLLGWLAPRKPAAKPRAKPAAKPVQPKTEQKFIQVGPPAGSSRFDVYPGSRGGAGPNPTPVAPADGGDLGPKKPQ